MRRIRTPVLKSKAEITALLKTHGHVDLPGLNVQEPWASLLVSGRKVVETRTYACSIQYLNRPIGIVATQRASSPKSALVGIVRIVESFSFPDVCAFRADEGEHLVEEGSVYDWKDGKPKWGWRIEVLAEVEPGSVELTRRGIVWTKNILLV